MVRKRTIRVWTGRPLGPNPRAHCWYETAKGKWARLCDGTAWKFAYDPNNDIRLNFAVFCLTCNGMHAGDFRSSRPRLHLMVPCDWREKYRPCPHNEETHVREGDMPRIAMSKLLNQYHSGMCISGVLKTTERTPLDLVSPLGPKWVATDSAL